MKPLPHLRNFATVGTCDLQANAPSDWLLAQCIPVIPSSKQSSTQTCQTYHKLLKSYIDLGLIVVSFDLALIIELLKFFILAIRSLSLSWKSSERDVWCLALVRLGSKVDNPLSELVSFSTSKLYTEFLDLDLLLIGLFQFLAILCSSSILALNSEMVVGIELYPETSEFIPACECSSEFIPADEGLEMAVSPVSDGGGLRMFLVTT
ncbi:hypothetical protein WICPIJ_007639 [Wickerhamomyces pijperi]|uniref:Uncharacterized protein n=1 Tax=Wickerhamomyces pijperi TaxID=599730 RepID=A0A9P8Q1A0_WICPI|nr:hypothetical protein WICPIJ_007639 [Wickerhamomyces pijperi]